MPKLICYFMFIAIAIGIATFVASANAFKLWQLARDGQKIEATLDDTPGSLGYS
jgi:hypothetical protein